jgi:hypothetical protein
MKGQIRELTEELPDKTVKSKYVAAHAARCTAPVPAFSVPSILNFEAFNPGGIEPGGILRHEPYDRQDMRMSGCSSVLLATASESESGGRYCDHTAKRTLASQPTENKGTDGVQRGKESDAGKEGGHAWR